MSRQITIGGMIVNLDYSKPDKNGRIYAPGVMEKALEDYNNKIKLEDRKKKIDKICQIIQIKKVK